jgi:hypothetical protein
MIPLFHYSQLDLCATFPLCLKSAQWHHLEPSAEVHKLCALSSRETNRILFCQQNHNFPSTNTLVCDDLSDFDFVALIIQKGRLKSRRLFQDGDWIAILHQELKPKQEPQNSCILFAQLYTELANSHKGSHTIPALVEHR